VTRSLDNMTQPSNSKAASTGQRQLKATFRLGGWDDVADLKKGIRITGTARDKLAADLKKKYEKGASIRALAEATGRSYGFVHRVLSESGVTLRGRGGATRTKKK
jgi:Helix-turn-helix domain